MKVNLMVRQIFQKAEVIKQNMTETWTKLEDLEGSYQQMMLRIHRLQVIFWTHDCSKLKADSSLPPAMPFMTRHQ